MVDLDDQLAVMTAMRDEGKIGAIGLGSVTLDGLRRAIPAGIACVQNAYSLVTRDDEDMLELCRPRTSPGCRSSPSAAPSPDAEGDRRSRPSSPPRRPSAARPHRSASPGCCTTRPHVLLIPGTAGIEHLEENIAAGAITFDRAMLATLDAIPSRSAEVPLG